MRQLKFLACLICLHGLLQSVLSADKYTDENRPYEFGFTIDGEQHRHEKKDENGIIMGEFGFITADGVYHVTVYATDENGNFKILSMKNIRVKPYPTAGGGEKKGHSIPFPPSENAPVLQGPSTAKAPQQESKPLQINKQISSPAKSCSHCSLPTTTTKAPPPQLTDIAVVSKDRPLPGSPLQTTPNNYQQNTPLSSFNRQNNDIGIRIPISPSVEQTNPPSPIYEQRSPNYQQANSQQDSFSGIQQNYPQENSFVNPSSPSGVPNPNYPQQNTNENSNAPTANNVPVGNDAPRSSPPITTSDEKYYTQEHSYVSQNIPQRESPADQYYPQQQTDLPKPVDNLQTPKDNSRNPKQYTDFSDSNVEIGQPQSFGAALAPNVNQPISDRPTLIAAQMQIVPKDTDIHHRKPGEQEGLPDGLSKDDMSHLLYTFNYTVGFHGHHEEGYSNGAKVGYYYVTGRNGVRTRVDYVADEKGFRPRISQEVLDLLSEDVPKPDTEKDEKFGLKGYEFKWIYYPTNERKK